jgi:hypothetical protein
MANGRNRTLRTGNESQSLWAGGETTCPAASAPSVDAGGRGLNLANFGDVLGRHPGGFGIASDAANPDTTWTDVTRVSIRGI